MLAVFAALALGSASSNKAAKSEDAVVSASSPAGEAAQEHIYTGYRALEQKNYDRAIESYSEAVKLTPNHPLPYYLRAVAYGFKGDYDLAIEDYSMAIQLNMDTPIPPYDYMEDFSSSAVSYVVMVDGRRLPVRNVKLENSAMYSLRANAHLAKSDYDSAIADYSEIIRQNPNSYSFNRRALVYDSKGDYDLAIADYTQAIQLSKDNNVTEVLMANRGMSYLEKGDYDNAIADFTQALRLNSSEAKYFNARGRAYEGKKTYHQAASDYEQAARLDPINPDYRDNLERVRKLQ